MEFKPLPEQQEIIDSRNKNLIVSASAGSGKTTVMIERICKLIMEGSVSPKGLLVLTYTKSAASEMKQKLYNAIRKNSDKIKNYAEVQSEIAVADISTIHSFCSRLIKKYFHVLGVSSNFQIIDEQKSNKIKQQIISEIISDLAIKDFEKYHLLMKNFGQARNYDNIVKTVLEINNYSKNYESSDQYLNSINFLYKNKNIAEKILNDNILEEKQNITKIIENLYKQCQSLSIEKYIKYLNETASELEKISKNNNFFDNCSNFSQISLPRLYKDKNVDPEINDRMEKLKESIQKCVKKYKQKNYGGQQTSVKAVENNLQIVNILVELEQTFCKNFQSYKQQNNVLDYSDLEEYAIKICLIPEIQSQLKKQYKYVFVDEYQDANLVQEKLLSLICDISNRFMVGDVKQSIYRFRGSKPEIFQQIESVYENDKNSQAKRLSVNFRSDKQILNFVNFVFEKIMTVATGGVDYKNKGMFNKTETNDLEQAKINILLCEKQKQAKKQVANGLYDLTLENSCLADISSNEKEALLVGKHILNLLNEQIVDGGIKRNIKFSDITILVRKRGDDYKEFCATLSQIGIPIYASTSSQIFENPESKRFINLLKTCVNSLDDIPLVSTMVTYFNFTEQELCQIKLENQQKYFYQNLSLYLQKNDKLSEKISNFYHQIENLRKMIFSVGGYLAVNDFLIKTKYLQTLQAKKDETRIDIVKKLLNELKKDDYNFDVVSFIDFVENGGEINLPNLSNGDNDFVNITTIHSSKGLEYPVVFLTDCGSDFTKSMVESVVYNEKLGLGLKYYDIASNENYNDIVCDAIKLKNAKEEFAEKLRLLYVGLTRPKHKLYIVGSVDVSKLEQINNETQVFDKKTFIELIMGCFDSRVLQNVKLKNNYVYKTQNMQICFEKENEFYFEKSENKKVVFGKGDKQLEEKFKQILNKQIKTDVVGLKNSVSGISSEHTFENVVYLPTTFDTENHLRENAAQQGTNFHKVLELLDYNDYQNQEKVTKICKQFDIDAQKATKALELLNEIFKNKKVQKENKFIMKVRYNQVVKSDIDDYVLVQGIIDAFCVDGDDAIIVDFKLTKTKNENTLKNRYNTQLNLYEMAIKKAYNVKNVKKYLLSLENCKLIKM